MFEGKKQWLIPGAKGLHQADHKTSALEFPNPSNPANDGAADFANGCGPIHLGRWTAEGGCLYIASASEKSDPVSTEAAG